MHVKEKEHLEAGDIEQISTSNQNGELFLY